MKKVALHNLGCKVNAYETEAMQEMLEKEGYEIVPFKEGADIYIINTCTVTNIADRKSRQMLHRARKMNPDAIVVAAGCYVQAQENEHHELDSCIDIVIGNNKKQDLIQILDEYESKCKTEKVIDINHTNEYENLNLSRTGEHTRAYIKVQDGCNQFCSYCIIPFARGRVRSRSLEDVVQEVTTLSGNGYKEVVLTGIHLTSYGVDNNKGSLLEVIMRLDKIEGLQRIRLGSLEPRVITEEFAKTLSSSKKICPHFHLSLQSGCDTVLKRMNRKYTTQEYYDKCCILRKYFNNPAIITSVVIAFPQETEEEFEATKVFLEKVHFYEMHIFKYSRRKGTVADRMEGQVDEKVKTQRSAILLELENKMSKEYRQQHIGKTEEVLIEEIVSENGKDYFMGFTPDYIRVKIACDTALDNSEYINTIKKVYMKELSDDGIVVTGIFEC